MRTVPRKAKAGGKASAKALTVASSPQEQCLRNSDLVDQILRHFLEPNGRSSLSYRESVRNIRSQRLHLYAAALTSRAFSHSAIKLLWRRLDNLLPLLRLLPTFNLTGKKYDLEGVVEAADWDTFDRHAALCREIVYQEPSRTVNPLVYVRLAMRKSIPLPNLSRFACGSGSPQTDVLFYISPSLVSLSLSSTSATETFLTLLSLESPPLAYLFLSGLPSTTLALCSAFRDLQSISLTDVDGAIDPQGFLAMASMPSLKSLKTDLIGWNQVTLESIAPDSIFCALTDLIIEAGTRPMQRTMPLLVTRIGAPAITSIRIDLVRDYEPWDTPTASGETFAALASCISSCWQTSLWNLEVQGLRCAVDDFCALQGLSRIKTISLKKVLQGSLGDERVLNIMRTWSHLTSLAIDGADADLEFIKCLAQHCPVLRTLSVAFLPVNLPDISTTPLLAHSLSELQFFPVIGQERRWPQVDVHVAARHIDRMFPQITSLSGEGYQNQWEEIQKLVFMCQDVRRTAWEQK
ncbi:hypothetical protein B0H16DRAFT_1688426 [Mycena metata]|uniref:Uncharacterized protein n=1 Tax=Mycena metata TaxID=1033252 RepID=A0AAD7JC82_9AGAR|nr:hypothetical protein B0H16DRAFT_1688426 [Mycena metata]